MVNGLDVFRRHFADCSDSYILIGGGACEINMLRYSAAFRATRDLDIVLCMEARRSGFIKAFWDFIKSGGYATGEKMDGPRQFYRFAKPANADYPYMLELFSRKPDELTLAEGTQLTPIPPEDEASSLSAILLNEDYYGFITGHRLLIDRLPVVSIEALIVLKAKAWMDLSDRKARGENIDSRNISKHRNDIARLLPFVVETALKMPNTIQDEMSEFLSRYVNESIDVKSLKLPFKEEQLKKILASILQG